MNKSALEKHHAILLLYTEVLKIDLKICDEVKYRKRRWKTDSIVTLHDFYKENSGNVSG